MKSPSLDNIYAQLNKHILLAQSYSEIKELFFIIKSCRLKPYSYILEDKNNKLILHNHWIDEFNNSLHITKNKKIKLTLNDLSIDKDKIICTDLYYGLPLDKILKISKLVYLSTGKDEDTFEDCCLISCLGIDNYLRTYIYMYGEWSQVSSLLLGLKNLKTISKQIDIDNFIELNNKENIVLPCISGRAWLVCLPATDEFLQLIEKQCEIIFPFFKGKTIDG